VQMEGALDQIFVTVLARDMRDQRVRHFLVWRGRVFMVELVLVLTIVIVLQLEDSMLEPLVKFLYAILVVKQEELVLVQMFAIVVLPLLVEAIGQDLFVIFLSVIKLSVLIMALVEDLINVIAGSLVTLDILAILM